MKNVFECSTVSEVLASELSRRKDKNKSYSLRAFARDLELSASRLSEVLNDNEGLSEKSADLVATRLAFKLSERQYFRDLVLANSSRNRAVRALASKRLIEIQKSERTRRLDEAHFRIIADWYHGAILELTQLKTFQTNFDWIAHRLGITTSQVADAVERLETLKLLKRTPSKWETSPEALSTFSKTPSTAIRKYHRQVLTMATDSILEDAVEDRAMSAMIVALPKARLDEFRQEITRFVSQFWEKVESDRPSSDELFALSIQLCPIRNRSRTKINRKTSKINSEFSADLTSEKDTECFD